MRCGSAAGACPRHRLCKPGGLRADPPLSLRGAGPADSWSPRFWPPEHAGFHLECGDRGPGVQEAWPCHSPPPGSLPSATTGAQSCSPMPGTRSGPVSETRPRATRLVRLVPRPRHGSPWPHRCVCSPRVPARPGGDGLLPAQGHRQRWPCPGSPAGGRSKAPDSGLGRPTFGWSHLWEQTLLPRPSAPRAPTQTWGVGAGPRGAVLGTAVPRALKGEWPVHAPSSWKCGDIAEPPARSRPDSL